MFDLAMTLLCSAALAGLALCGLGALLLPVYLLVLRHDAATAPTAAEQAEIDKLLAST